MYSRIHYIVIVYLLSVSCLLPPQHELHQGPRLLFILFSAVFHDGKGKKRFVRERVQNCISTLLLKGTFTHFRYWSTPSAIPFLMKLKVKGRRLSTEQRIWPGCR